MKILHPLPSVGDKVGQTEWVGDHSLPATALGNKSGAVSLSLSDGIAQTMTITGNVTITLPAVAAWLTEPLTLLITNGAGSLSITVTGVLWLGGAAPDFDDANGAKNVITFRAIGGTWLADGDKVA